MTWHPLDANMRAADAHYDPDTPEIYDGARCPLCGDGEIVKVIDECGDYYLCDNCDTEFGEAEPEERDGE